MQTGVDGWMDGSNVKDGYHDVPYFRDMDMIKGLLVLGSDIFQA